MKNANKLIKDRRKGNTAPVPPKTAPQAPPKKTGEHVFDFISNIRNMFMCDKLKDNDNHVLLYLLLKDNDNHVLLYLL